VIHFEKAMRLEESQPYQMNEHGFVRAEAMCFVWAEKVKTETIRWPATWRDAISKRWSPAWFKRRWPVRWDGRVITVWRAHDMRKESVYGERMEIHLELDISDYTAASAPIKTVFLEKRRMHVGVQVAQNLLDDTKGISRLLQHTAESKLSATPTIEYPATWLDVVWQRWLPKSAKMTQRVLAFREDETDNRLGRTQLFVEVERLSDES